MAIKQQLMAYTTTAGLMKCSTTNELAVSLPCTLQNCNFKLQHKCSVNLQYLPPWRWTLVVLLMSNVKWLHTLRHANKILQQSLHTLSKHVLIRSWTKVTEVSFVLHKEALFTFPIFECSITRKHNVRILFRFLLRLEVFVVFCHQTSQWARTIACTVLESD